MKKKLKNKIFLIYVAIIIISLISFAIVTFINWSLLTGFIIGSIFGIISFFLTKFYSTQLLSKRRTFKFSFLIGIFKSILWMILFCGLFIGILFANNLITGSWIDGTFNIFTFIYGCVTIPLAIIVFNIFDTIANRNKKKKENINKE